MGESKISRLHLFGLALFAAFIGLSVWTAFVAITMQYDSLLSLSILDLLLFLAATVAKRSSILLLSWVWMGADFVLGQVLLIPRIDYLEVVVSVTIVLLAVDLSNFLEFVYPMQVRAAKMDERQYERTWSLVKRHTRSASLLITAAGALGLIGIALTGPVVFAPNPVLVIGIVTSLVLILTAALSFERRPRHGSDVISEPYA